MDWGRHGFGRTSFCLKHDRGESLGSGAAGLLDVKNRGLYGTKGWGSVVAVSFFAACVFSSLTDVK
jgi:hypothetical protein